MKIRIDSILIIKTQKKVEDRPIKLESVPELPAAFTTREKMPYSKDIRCGQGWFNTNINLFFDYLDNMDEEIIVNNDDYSPSEVAYHNKWLEEEIELKVNEYIFWKVFGEQRKKLDEDDDLPEDFDGDIWGYVYNHIIRLVKRKDAWYSMRSTVGSEQE